MIVIDNGKVKVHVMPDFSTTPLYSETDLNNWLNFFEVPTPLVGVGYLVSNDPVIIFPIQYTFFIRLYCFYSIGFGLEATAFPFVQRTRFRRTLSL